MKLFLLDTDHLSLYQRKHAGVVNKVEQHLKTDRLAISVITVDEQLTGWQAVIRSGKKSDEARVEEAYLRMAQTVESLAKWSVLHFPRAAMRRYDDMKKLKLNVDKNDLKIAAIALEFGAVVVTHNTRDYCRIPGLELEDWAV